MKQTSLDLKLSVMKTRRRELMEQVVPRGTLVEFIAPYYLEGRNCRPSFCLETMLREHFMQQWFTLADPGTEETFFDVPLYREFAQLDGYGRLPDESAILRFRHRLEGRKQADQILANVNGLLGQRGLLLKVGPAVDAALIAAPSSTTEARRCIRPRRATSGITA